MRFLQSDRRALCCCGLLPWLALLGGALLQSGATQSLEQPRTNDRDGARMVFVPEGPFIMGSSDADIAAITRADPRSQPGLLANERPRRTVSLNGYWIYKTEVTVAQYRRFCSETGRKMPEPPNWGWKDDHPMVNVAWSDAMAYARWAGADLPTEEEWEKAARGADGRFFAWGNTWPPPQGVGNFADVTTKRKYRTWVVLDAYDDGYAETAPVGAFPKGASPYGVLDMAGNVWEWCADSADPQSRSSGNVQQARFRSVRGGSWSNYGADFLHAARRHRKEATERDHNLGFRCVVRKDAETR